MQILGDLTHFEISTTTSAASAYTETQVVIADNIIKGNAILIKKVEFQDSVPADIPAAGVATETTSQHLGRQTKSAIMELDDDDLLCKYVVEAIGDATNALIMHRNRFQNPHIFGLGEKDDELFPYKYLYHGVDDTNAAATSNNIARVWYYPVKLSDAELLEVTQEAIING